MPLLIRDLGTFSCCLMMAGCQTLPDYERPVGLPPVIPMKTDMRRAADPDDSPTVIYLTQALEKPKPTPHVLRWPFTQECGAGCGAMWTLIGISVAVGLAVVLNHRNKPGCVAKVKQCGTWPNCTYPALPPGCSYDFGS